MEEKSTQPTIRWLTTHRLEALSDGIFAIAMTLLVLNLNIPPMSESMAAAELPGKLLELWPHFFALAMSFFLLSVFWIIHHRQFHVIKRVDETLLWLNAATMLFIILIPFSTSLHGEYESTRIAALFFEGNLFFAGIASFLTYRYATYRHKLVDEDLTSRQIRIALTRNAAMPVASLVAMGVSFITPQYSTLTYAFIPIFLLFLR